MKQLGVALVCGVTVACGGSGEGSIPAGAPSAIATAMVSGMVGYEALPNPGVLPPPNTFPRPFQGAMVVIVSARGEGAISTTDNNGVYTLQVSAGTFRLRYSAWGYVTSESNETTVAAGDQITMPAVRLKTGPWAVAGTVTDSRGPVAGLSIGISTGPFSGGSVTTDSAGRYRYVAAISPSGFVEPHFWTVSIGASAPGIVPESHGGRCCNSPEDTVFDFAVRRVLGVAISGPSTMHVGETTTFDVRVTFDDSVLVLRTPCPSDNPAVLAVENDSQGSRMRAISPGIATVTCGYLGVTTTARVQVL